jgi:glycosyltransferase involved in cell wall biosynthesis
MEAATDSHRQPLLVFADDWGRHPSSCQHLIRLLVDRHPTLWVNTIGTRKPSWNFATFRRGFEKLGHWFRQERGQAALPPGLRVLNPRMWPWFTSTLDRRINRGLLTRQLSSALSRLSTAPIAVTTLPITSDLIGRLPVRRWVYYCVDDFSEWPGLDGTTLRQMEQTLVARADRIIAVSHTLQDRLATMGRRSDLLTHGVDLDWWQNPLELEQIPKLAFLERPLVVFWGVIDRRMDVQFLSRLAQELSSGTIVLAGPASDPDPALSAMNRVVRLGHVPFASLPCLAREAAALIMPYADVPVTRAMQPLKLKEYLATGKPVVVRDLPSTRCWDDCLDLAVSAQAFTDAVRQRLESGLPTEHKLARRRLAGESWSKKAELFERMIMGREDAQVPLVGSYC